MADSFHSTISSAFSTAMSGGAPPPSAPVESAPAASPEPAAAPAAESAPSSPAVESAPASDSPAPVTETPAPAEAAPVELGEEEEFKFEDEKETAKPVEAKADDDDPLETKKVAAADLPAVTRWLKTPKGRAALEQFKVARELEKDLGFRPDAAQIKDFHANATRYQHATTDFMAAQPDTAQRWLTNWLSPIGEKATPAALQVASQFMPLLAKHADNSPAAQALYQAAAAPAVHNWINELYDYARSMPTKEERVQWLNVARFSEAHFSGGEFREIPNELVETGKDSRAPDPRVAEIDQKLARIQNFEQQQVQRNEQQFSADVKAAIEAPLFKDIDAALSQIRDQVPEKVYNAIAKEFHAEVVKQTRANPANLRAYFEARATAKANPTQENKDKAGKAWADCARPAIRSLRPSYINDALGPKAAESAQRHKTLAEASQKHGAPSVAAPVEKALTNGPITPLKGENYRDAVNRSMRNLMQNAS